MLMKVAPTIDGHEVKDIRQYATWSGKFGGDQLTAYVYLKADHSAFFDDEDSNEGNGFGLIGKRIYGWDDQGFFHLFGKFHDADTARAEFDMLTEADDDEEDEP